MTDTFDIDDFVEDEEYDEDCDCCCCLGDCYDDYDEEDDE